MLNAGTEKLTLPLNSVTLYSAIRDNDLSISGEVDVTVRFCLNDDGSISNELDIVESVDRLDISEATVMHTGRKVPLAPRVVARLLDSKNVRRDVTEEAGLAAWAWGKSRAESQAEIDGQ